MITPELIDRINALAQKKKAQGLSPEEQEEQNRLRRVYLDHIKAQLHETLSRVHIVEADAGQAPEEIEATETSLPDNPGKAH